MIDGDRLPDHPEDIPRWWNEHGPFLEGVKIQRRGSSVYLRSDAGPRLELFRRASEWRAQRWNPGKVGPSEHVPNADHLVLLVRGWVAGMA